MKKAMLVTVGTSLFHSASWDAAQVDFPDYREWTVWKGEPPPLTSPERRKRTPRAEAIQAWLSRELRTDNAEAWAARLPADLRGGTPNGAEAMRYSAELATILKLFDASGQAYRTVGELLGSYDRIWIVHDPTSPLPLVAAYHLAAYLNRLADGAAPAVPYALYGLSSLDPAILLGESSGLGLLAQFVIPILLSTEQLDLVVSGGFKLYGISLAALPHLEDVSVRLLYIHEEGGQLLQIPKKLKKPTQGATLSEHRQAEIAVLIRDVGMFP